MPTVRNSAAFAGIVSELLERGNIVRFRANGCSMGTAIRDGEVIYVEPITAGTSKEQIKGQDQAKPQLHPLPVSGHDFSRAATTSQNRALAPEVGDILLTYGTAGFKAHRLVANDQNLYITQGDSVQTQDTPVRENQVLGRVIAVKPHARIVFFTRKLVGTIRRILRNRLNLRHLQTIR